jgi:hypothetical protein
VAIGVVADATFNLNLADVFFRHITLHMNDFANVQPSIWEAMRLNERGGSIPRSTLLTRSLSPASIRRYRFFIKNQIMR